MRRKVKKAGANEAVMLYYESLFGALGPQGWWPGRTRFEIITGAILTQNTAWTNVEKAIWNLKSANLLTPEKMRLAPVSELSVLIRPAGYFNVKAKRLKNFIAYLYEKHGGSLARLFKRDAKALRAELLGVNGIGPETADSIILYAGGHPEFVIDAYTKRISARHALAPHDVGYDDLKALFTKSLPLDAVLFNEYHALIVKTGKDYCKSTNPRCSVCPLGAFLKDGE